MFQPHLTAQKVPGCWREYFTADLRLRFAYQLELIFHPLTLISQQCGPINNINSLKTMHIYSVHLRYENYGLSETTGNVSNV